MRFAKMHGLGNDYVYINGFETDVRDPSALARKMAHRHRGVGSDGMILILPSETADCRMRMWNADGSEGEMCGNGIRCVGKYVFEQGIAVKECLRVETAAGIRELQLQIRGGQVSQVRVNMGPPILAPEAIPAAMGGGRIVNMPLEVLGTVLHVTCVSMGNPHCVVFVDDVRQAPVRELGPAIEHHAVFPSRINVEFVQVVSHDEVLQRTWERGSGETMACGTGASAVCVAGLLCKKTGTRVRIRLTGGDLTLAWTGREADPVYMTGPATHVYWGDWPDS